MANQPTKLTTEKLVDVLSHENVHNIPHLLQFLSFQVVLLLQVNFAVCNNPICLCYANQAYHCEDLSYNDVCHLNATCSGFVNHIGTTRACLLSTRIWLCHLHSSPTANGNSSTQPDTFSWCPTPLSLNSPLNKGMSLADAKNSK